MKKLPKIAAIMLTAAIACGCSDLTNSSTVSDTATESTPSVTSDAPDESSEAPETQTSVTETEAPETSAPETSAEESSEAETTASVSEESSAPAPVTDVDSYRAIGDNGILVAGMDGHYRGIMFYGGTYGYCDQYVTDVKAFQSALPEVTVYSMVIPTSVDFYNPDEYSGYTELQKDKIEYIENELKNTGVTNIKVYDTLSKHTDEDIYARTDHHWMPLGAYYAAQVFCKDAGVKVPDISKYRKETCGGYVGSMYYYSSDVNLYNDPEQYTVYYSPNEDKLTTTYYDRYYSNGYESNLFLCNDASYYYLSFLGSDDLIAHIKTNASTGRNLVVIKESYGNALIPFLTESFDNIYVLDLRYCEVNAVNFCKQVGATDLLFANCAYTVAGGNCDYFSYIRNI
ncbi:MAG: DHHW family protein [Ruminiclostridium sp.]